MQIEELKKNLETAMRHIDLLCSGFSVTVKPPYRTVLDSVCHQIKLKKTMPIKHPEVIFYLGGTHIRSSVTTATGLSLLEQFKQKFIAIAKTEIIPELKKFCRVNKDVSIEDFRPLFDICLKHK